MTPQQFANLPPLFQEIINIDNQIMAEIGHEKVIDLARDKDKIMGLLKRRKELRQAAHDQYGHHTQRRR